MLDLVALGLLAASAFVALSLLTFDPADPPSTAVFPAPESVVNACGPVGARVAHYMLSAFGFGTYLILINLIVIDLQLFSRGNVKDRWMRLAGSTLMLVAICTAFDITAPAVGTTTLVGSGGLLGAVTAATLESLFSGLGATVLLMAILTAGLIITEDALLAARFVGLLLKPFAFIGHFFGNIRLPRLNFSRFVPSMWRKRSQESISTEEEIELEDETEDAPEADAAADREIRINPPATLTRSLAAPRPPVVDSPQEIVEIDLPDLDLLEDAEEFPYEELAANARIAAETLEQTFQEFGLNVTVSEIDTGPVVTQYELKLEKGLRVNKVTALADDLAIALRVPAVRIVSPIPGKNTVGVEVPNETRVMVRMRELIETAPEKSQKFSVPLFLGKDVSGHPLVVDMTKMPHLLIAGRTGTGKSVCINTLILSILYTRRPDEVKLLMVDPKMVELSPYKRLPHLMHPVITDMKKAEAMLAWAVDKMEERYDILARCGVRHLDDYNKLSREQRLDRMGLSELEIEPGSLPEKMPYIVIIADEMADMMMTSGKDVEGHIIRLAQKSRAVGIHLVLATQKPTVDVITGLIKSNLPARISFQVASRTDSRVVLDEMGAERLLGAGDMLYLEPGTSNLIRSQGTYISGQEVDNVIDFFGDVEPQYSDELKNVTASGGSGKTADADEIRKKDDMYEQAIDVVVSEGRGSTSLLQRALGIGYGRAARLIDYMAEDGIVGEYNGSQAREVLYTAEQWEAVKSGGELVEV
ncbi:DNA translocase FtsK [Stratiformator vulcanicus]|uniref:DNA translocase FtsK n=2 Tax=Stratiformator vulcanicus TaxID=2527980 RepID=A0A517R6E9_9PLAN|nr:DNA translocase FtsK [Stratiformator vulcanicus]